MKKDHARFSLLNFGSSGIKNIITTLVGFIATPFIIKAIGDTNFGLYKTLIDIFGHFSILELGLYGTLLSLFIRESAQRPEAMPWVLRWGIKQYKKVTLLSLALSSLVSYLLYLKFSSTIANKDLVISLIYCQLFFLILPTLPYKAYLEANHQSYKVNLLQLLNALLYSGIGVSFAYFIPSLSSQILATTLALLISHLLYLFLVKMPKKTTDIEIQIEGTSKIQLSYFLNDVSGRLCLMCDNLIIAFVMGPKLVVPFFLTQRLAQTVQGQLLNIGNSTWSTLGLIFHSGEMGLFNKRLIELTRIISILGGVTLVTLVLFNQSFISLWVSDKEFAGTSFTLIACLNTFFLPLLTLWGWSFNYSQLVQKTTPVMWFQAILNIIFSIVFTYQFGNIGPILGTLLAYILAPLPILSLLMKKHYGTSLMALHKSWLLPLIYSLLLTYFLALMPNLINVRSWIELIIKMFLVSGFTLMSAVFLFLSKTERKEYLERVMKLFKKNKID
ncbi:MAG: lipopolysaccharide biosynthesis protein [Bacteriovoracaceae bacterium]